MSHNSEAIRLHATWLTKSLIWALFNRHKPGGKPDIWIFGSRRSGSTLLMQTIARNPGVKFSDHPFSIRSVGLYDLRLLQTIENGPYLEVYPELVRELTPYIEDMIAGQLHVNEPWRIWSEEFKFRSDRIVFKATDIPHLASWIEATFRCQVIFLVRHPISQATSTFRNNWMPRYRAYLQNQAFVARYLSREALAECERIGRDGSALQKHVLAWCCENVVLIKEIDGHPRRGFIPYEDLVAYGDDAAEGLSRAYQLPNASGMKASLQAPSTSTVLSTGEIKGAIRKRHTAKLLSRWRENVDPAAEADALGILKLFGIDLYVPGDDSAKIKMRFPDASGV